MKGIGGNLGVVPVHHHFPLARSGSCLMQTWLACASPVTDTYGWRHSLQCFAKLLSHLWPTWNERKAYRPEKHWGSRLS